MSTQKNTAEETTKAIQVEALPQDQGIGLCVERALGITDLVRVYLQEALEYLPEVKSPTLDSCMFAIERELEMIARLAALEQPPEGSSATLDSRMIAAAAEHGNQPPR